MACSASDPLCWSSPSNLNLMFPPPPPIPSFMVPILSKENVTDLETEGDMYCNLCSKWGDNSFLTQEESGSFTFVLTTIVAILSALAGAGLTAAVLSVRRLRKRRSHPESMRHLERKCNEHQSLPLPPSRSANSTPLSNTYCEGPYNNENKNTEYLCHNIYAELQTNASNCGSTSDIWRRPPIPTPCTQDNCYLELRDLPPKGCPAQVVGVSTPFLNLNSQTPIYSLSPSSTTASYYTDLEVKNAS